jgi:transposase
MKEKEPPQKRDRESLEKLTHQELVEMVLTCQELISKQNEVLERLKSYLGKDSKTSSKPPSSDLPKRPEKAKEEKTPQGRRPGGQKGHPGKTRKGFGRVDRSEFLPATKCNSCGSENLEKVGVTERSQVVAQLVERPIEVVEYRQQCTHCKDCGQKVVAPLPPDVVPGQDLGVSLQAMLGWMSHYGHLSYEKQQEWLREIGKIEVGVGTLQATTRRLSEAVKGSIERLQEWVKKQPQVHVDESPWLVKGLKEWMWIISGEGFALFHAGDTRSRSELESLLGQSFAGVLISDDFSVYNGYRSTAQQKCLAHLLRHFKQVEKLNGTNHKELAGVFLTLITESFSQHREYRQTRNRSLYDEWVVDFKKRLKEEIEHWKSKAGYAAGLLLKSLVLKSHQWWYFLDHPEVPPDNNNAERPLRLGVTKRKVCGGSRSMDGFNDTARLLTVIQTCRAQGRSVLEFLRQALTSVAHKLDNLLSLIPSSDSSLFVNP